jgi:hypothetical protein
MIKAMEGLALIKAFPNIIMTIINPLMNYKNHTYTKI